MTEFARIVAYLRFSTREQIEGTSTKRQREDCARYVRDSGWGEIDEWLADEGVSAFRGKNREVGTALGDFEEEVRAGLQSGTLLVVERLDRISRQGFDETLDFIRLLTTNGVSLSTVDGAEFYEAGKKLDIMQVMKVLLKTELAHEESAKKAQRLKRRWEIRREESRIDGRVLTKLAPPWLRVEDRRFVVTEDRAALVRRMFDLADAGCGSLTITRILNKEGVATWQRFENRVAKLWQRTTISRILANRAVTGEYQPHEEVNGAKVPVGEPWANYFPVIVDAALFERVTSSAKARQSPAGRRGSVVVNLVSGLAKCAECGGRMVYKRRRQAGSTYVTKPAGNPAILKHDDAALQCYAAFHGGACGNRAEITYYGFERALLDSSLHLALDDRAFARKGELGRITTALAERRREHEIATAKAAALWDAYAATASAMAMNAAVAAETIATTIATYITGLEGKARKAAGEADAEEHLSRIASFRRHLYDDDLEVRARHRLKVAEGYRQIIESVVFDRQKGATINFVGDARFLRIQGGKIVRNWNMLKPGRKVEGATKEKTVTLRTLARRAREAA